MKDTSTHVSPSEAISNSDNESVDSKKEITKDVLLLVLEWVLILFM